MRRDVKTFEAEKAEITALRDAAQTKLDATQSDRQKKSLGEEISGYST
jgi:hypothetical protein